MKRKKLFYFLTIIHTVCGIDVRIPPTIVASPSKESHDYRGDDDYLLECVAVGISEPMCEWFKDGELMTGFGGRLQHVTEGIIKINQMGTLDEGSYQCRCKNEHGTAVTRDLVLRRAVLAQYPSKSIFISPEIKEGTNYTLYCQRTKWYPKPIFSWTIINNLEDEMETPVFPDKRVQIDEDGNLHFSYVLAADAQDGRLYKCKLFNNVLDLTIGGSYSQLNVIPVGGVKPFPPSALFTSQSPLIGLEQQSITLRCFFSGSPDPMISWSRDGASLPIGRYQISNRNTELMIKNLQPTDAGIYFCVGQNSQNHNSTKTIEVIVDAHPVFKSPSDGPQDMNVTEGSDITINCKSYAKPSSQIQWFVNGDKIYFPDPTNKFQVTEDLETLTISNVCKECEDGSSDLMVIQCNSSNEHGYAFDDGYVNIIRETMIILAPKNVTMDVDTETGEFTCNATADDITPVTYSWYEIHGDERRREKLGKGHEPYFRVTEEGKKVVIFLPHNTTKRSEYIGEYECEADNGYSTSSATAYLTTDKRPPPPPAVVPYIAGIVDLWWIIVVVVGIFLLFLLCLICCICCHRNRGDVYPVDKKERKNGNDPEQELAKTGFHEHRRPDAAPMKGSHVSLASSISVSDEEMSLNEYGDIDEGKFTEEGSFISNYANDRKTMYGMHAGHNDVSVA